MKFIKPEEKEEFTSSFFFFNYIILKYKCRFLSLKNLWSCVSSFFFLYIFFVCRLVTIFLNQSIRNHFHTLIYKANCDRLLSRNRAWLYTYRNLYITLSCWFSVLGFFFFLFFFYYFLEIWPKWKKKIILLSLCRYHIMKKKLKTLY